ncbi:small acid-soluble spore protein I (minor) [Paenibacillus algorifonticola]|uniref:Small, acid-soluble spore protein I n=1 Tax=Paenibacillus algorifonticola TaxID=684063 RepID=A0A1I2FUM6_9BACL|nr:small acid-soluble spore protein SspI [Paenibacillus algorifonticola]SFF08467.1 small acid-soluble spore protein I (minor) [Paenibacillus algorifonticola]
MDNLDLRQAIIRRVQDKPLNELTEVIESSIGNDERALPGLGVLFEMIWKQIDEQEQARLVTALHTQLSRFAQPATS